MTARILICLVSFWLTQVAAQILFKWGSTSEARWLWGFLGGNLICFFSIWLLMLIYKVMNPNIALGVAIGGAFLLSQVALMLAFRSRVAPLQWAGIAAIVLGILVLAAGMEIQAETRQQPSAAQAELGRTTNIGGAER